MIGSLGNIESKGFFRCKTRSHSQLIECRVREKMKIGILGGAAHE